MGLLRPKCLPPERLFKNTHEFESNPSLYRNSPRSTCSIALAGLAIATDFERVPFFGGDDGVVESITEHAHRENLDGGIVGPAVARVVDRDVQLGAVAGDQLDTIVRHR